MQREKRELVRPLEISPLRSPGRSTISRRRRLQSLSPRKRFARSPGSATGPRRGRRAPETMRPAGARSPRPLRSRRPSMPGVQDPGASKLQKRRNAMERLRNSAMAVTRPWRYPTGRPLGSSACTLLSFALLIVSPVTDPPNHVQHLRNQRVGGDREPSRARPCTSGCLPSNGSRDRPDSTQAFTDELTRPSGVDARLWQCPQVAPRAGIAT